MQYDAVNLGVQPIITLPHEQQAFNAGLELLWQQALKAGSHSAHKKKITINQAGLDLLRNQTRRSFTRLAASITTCSLGTQSKPTGADLFYRCANHYYHSESGREFRQDLGGQVFRLNCRRTAIRSDGLRTIPEINPFVSTVMASLAVSCNANSDAFLGPLYVTYDNIRKAMKSLRTNLGKKVKEWSQRIAFCDVFYAALFTLVHCQKIAGEVIRCTGRVNSRPILDWFQASHGHAVQLGFLEPGPTNLQDVSRFVTYTSTYRLMVHFDGAEFDRILSSLPTFVENPEAIMHKMWFLQKYRHLLQSTTYCMYGARWKKPTVFWVNNFTWTPLLQCGLGNVTCDWLKGKRSNKHPDLVTGSSTNHTMAEKWWIPHKLCIDILRNMLKARPASMSMPTYYVSLFAGAGSFDEPCATLGLTHVSVSYDRPSDQERTSNKVHVFLDLKEFDLRQVLKHIWHLTGLHPTNLLGVGAHPPCETYSLLAARWGGRDHSLEGFYLPTQLANNNCGANDHGREAEAADNMTAHCFSQLFQNAVELGAAPPGSKGHELWDISYVYHLFHRKSCRCAPCTRHGHLVRSAIKKPKPKTIRARK
jgi:hypothetical protein